MFLFLGACLRLQAYNRAMSKGTILPWRKWVWRLLWKQKERDGCYSAAVSGTLIQAALPLDMDALSSSLSLWFGAHCLNPKIPNLSNARKKQFRGQHLEIPILKKVVAVTGGLISQVLWDIFIFFPRVGGFKNTFKTEPKLVLSTTI